MVGRDDNEKSSDLGQGYKVNTKKGQSQDQLKNCDK